MNERVPDSSGLPLRAMVMVLLFLGVIFLLVGFQAMGSGNDSSDDSSSTPTVTSTTAKTSAAPAAKAPAKGAKGGKGDTGGGAAAAKPICDLLFSPRRKACWDCASMASTAAGIPYTSQWT